MQSKVSFRAAAVQTLAALDDLDANITLVRRYTEEAVRRGAQLVVFPECMNSGYLFDDPAHCRSAAETLSGEYVAAITDLCRQYGIFIASGFTELDESSGGVFNSGLLFDPRGRLIAHYQKQFLATHDQNWFSVGERGCPVVDTELGRLGLLICFDGRIPEIARVLSVQGVDIIIDMANFFTMDQADLWVPARAYENGVWVVAATKAGVERSIYYPGGSMIVTPAGSTVARVPIDRHGLAVADVTPATARDKRWQDFGDRIADRRSQAYSILVAPFEQTPLAPQLEAPLVPETSTTKVAAIQAHALPEPGSLDTALDMVDHAAKLGVKVLVLPQYFAMPSWLPTVSDARDFASAQAAAHARVAEICRKYACLAILPKLEEADGQLVQSAPVIDERGDVLGVQYQVHPEPGLPVDPTAEQSFQVFDTSFGRVGLIVGYDGMFPESSRVLALQGADIIAWPSAWRDPHDRKLLSVPKAEDNRCYVVCSNRTDAPCPGGSLVIGPTGYPLWDLDLVSPAVTRHGAVFPAFVNLALARQKSMIPGVDMVRNRLVETYQPLLEPPGSDQSPSNAEHVPDATVVRARRGTRSFLSGDVRPERGSEISAGPVA